MSSVLLTFELDNDKDQLFIHGDPISLRRLGDMLIKISELAAQGEFPHEHLFSAKWGGDDLTLEPQEEGHECLNHVKIFGWPTKEGSKPFKAKS